MQNNYGFLQQERLINEEEIDKFILNDSKFQEMLRVAKDEENSKKLAELGHSISSKFKNVVFVGIGGSTLAGKAYYQISKDNVKNDVYFLDNLNSSSISKLFNKVDFKDTFFVFISKSGNTIETVSQMVTILDHFKKNSMENDIKSNCLCVTKEVESSTNQMLDMARRFEIQTLSWSGDVSGRFSAFSNNINLIKSILGLDIIKHNKQFVDLVENFTKNEHCIQRLNLTLLSVKNKLSSTILMCYDDAMENFAKWYEQIWSESIGKEGLGTNPVVAIGPVDQHSKLQMYLGGQKDKVFTVMYTKNSGNDKPLKSFTADFNSMEYLSNVNITQIVESCAVGTIKSLIDQNLPCTTIVNEANSPEYIADMMGFYIVETFIACSFFKLNPYNQPEVEASKVNLYQNLRDINK